MPACEWCADALTAAAACGLLAKHGSYAAAGLPPRGSRPCGALFVCVVVGGWRDAVHVHQHVVRVAQGHHLAGGLATVLVRYRSVGPKHTVYPHHTRCELRREGPQHRCLDANLHVEPLLRHRAHLALAALPTGGAVAALTPTISTTASTGVLRVDAVGRVRSARTTANTGTSREHGGRGHNGDRVSVRREARMVTPLVPWRAHIQRQARAAGARSGSRGCVVAANVP